MIGISTDLSQAALSAAIMANLFEWWRYLGRSPGAEFFDGQEVTYLRTGIPVSFLNPVLRTQADANNVDTTIEDTVAHFNSIAATKISWWIGADTQPVDLERHLVDHGFAFIEDGPGMAVDLFDLNEEQPVPAGLTIERVEDAKSLRKWDYASIHGFGMPEIGINTWFDLFAGLGFELPVCNYVGILNGEPVAASQLFLGAGVAGIYMVATIPEARGKGIGTAMTVRPLLEARAMGCRIGVLQSSLMAVDVYRRLGFREYCKLNHYEK